MNEIIFIQTSILKNELLLEKAIVNNFIEIQAILHNNLEILYDKLNQIKQDKTSSGIKENLNMNEKICITLTKSNGSQKITNI